MLSESIDELAVAPRNVLFVQVYRSPFHETISNRFHGAIVGLDANNAGCNNLMLHLGAELAGNWRMRRRKLVVFPALLQMRRDAICEILVSYRGRHTSEF